MATRQLSPATIGALIAGVFVALVVGYLVYIFLFATKAAVQADASKHYDTSIIATELSADNAKSIFLLTVPLTTPTNNTTGGVPYNPSELGKTDITQIGK